MALTGSDYGSTGFDVLADSTPWLFTSDRYALDLDLHIMDTMDGLDKVDHLTDEADSDRSWTISFPQCSI